MPRESIEILSFNVSVCIVFVRVPSVIQPMAFSAKPPSTKSRSADAYVRHSWVPFYHSQPPLSHTSTPQPTSHVILLPSHSHSSPKSHNHPLLSQTITLRVPDRGRCVCVCVWLIVSDNVNVNICKRVRVCRWVCAWVSVHLHVCVCAWPCVCGAYARVCVCHRDWLWLTLYSYIAVLIF